MHIVLNISNTHITKHIYEQYYSPHMMPRAKIHHWNVTNLIMHTLYQRIRSTGTNVLWIYSHGIIIPTMKTIVMGS